MANPVAVDAFLQKRLDSLGLEEVPAVDAARWLDEAGLLKDSRERPGLPLRRMLRAGDLAHAEQRPPTSNGRWFIVRAATGTTNAVSTEPSAVATDERATIADKGRSISRPTNAPMDTTQRHVDATATSAGAASRCDAFKRSGLAARGFVGFERFNAIALDRIPRDPGVYVVLRENDSRPAFLERNPGGWFKGQDPTVPVEELERAWADAAHCVYIGKAGAGSAHPRGLRQRIKEFRQFGDGLPVGHQGGRRIWQLADADDYVLTWIPTPDEDPGALEAEMLRAFVAEHGRLPIGNRTTGRSTA